MVRNKKRRAATYAKPTVTGNQTMSFDLAQAKFSSSLNSGVVLTPNKIRALLGLNSETVDAIKITSIVVGPWVEHTTPSSGSGASAKSETQWKVDFADGQRFIATDKAKPTKIKPSMLSPAGRWNDASSTSIQLATITGPSFTDNGTTYQFRGTCIVNVAIRCDQPTQTALTPGAS